MVQDGHGNQGNAMQPYQGLFVLDAAQGIAGPYCGMLLAAMGAEVVKLEPPKGDWSRGLTTREGSHSVMSSVFNRGKRSLVLDLAAPAEREKAQALMARADVVIEAFRPGVAGRIGLGPAHARADAVYVSISGFGQTGPLRQTQAYAHLINAFSGMMELERAGVHPPRVSNLQAADVLAGAHAFGLVCAALLRKAKTGQGAYLDVSMLECLICADDVSFAALLNGHEATRQPRPSMVIHPVGGKHIAMQIGGAPGMWEKLIRIMNRPDLAADERFLTGPARRQNWPQVLEIIYAWLDTFDSVDEVMALLSAERFPAVPMLQPEDIVAHPHLQLRQAFPVIRHPARPQGVTVTATPAVET
jgi:formyl-CoA transferase